MIYSGEKKEVVFARKFFLKNVDIYIVQEFKRLNSLSKKLST